MHINILGLAIPLFVGLMLLEYYISKRKNLKYFNLHNSIANVSIGVAERLTDVMIAGAFYFVYVEIKARFGLFDIKPGIFLWILLFLCTDFVWYWYHRLAHEMNILWAAHIVHHQSEDFNYTVSARITVFQAVARTGFWSILPLVGFPAGMITSMLLIHGLYPFFIHTRLIGRLGILEYFLVTPSHHRVHHGSNEKYLDKNYGDVLIIWDKLFGTFQKEQEEPTYGLTKPLNTHSFLWQHFHFTVELILAIRSEKGFFRKFKILFQRPDKINPGLRAQAEEIFNVRKTAGAVDKPMNRYVIYQMVFLLITLTAFILFENSFPLYFKGGYCFIVLLTLINCGAIMEQKKWIFYIEIMRMSVVLLLPLFFPGYEFEKLAVLFAIVLILLQFYQTFRSRYLRYVYNGPLTMDSSEM